MGALIKLQAKAYFSNIFAKVDYFTTVIFLLVLGSLVLSGHSDWKYNDPRLSRLNIAIISSITILMVMNSALYSFGFSFFEMKDSILLKRIGATKITKIEAIGSFLIWGMTTMVFILAWISFWVGIFQIPAIAKLTGGLLYVSPKLWENVNWGGFVVSILITSISFYAIAFFFVSILSDAEQYNIMTTFYFFVVAFLGGVFTPNANREWMKIIGHMSPLGWGSELMNHSMQGLPVFDLGGYKIPLHDDIGSFEAVGHFAFPIIYGSLAAGASLKFFKWD